jgi:hypothetical protein
MKKLLLTIGAGYLAMSAFPQTTANPGKFYFPVAHYDDSVGFDKAISKLATQVAIAYSDPNRRTFLENSINYDLLSGNYERAMDRIDSIRKLDEDNSYGIEIKSYALAKIAEKKTAIRLKALLERNFRTRLILLP